MSLASAIKAYSVQRRSDLAQVQKGKYGQAVASGVGDILSDVVSVASKVGKGATENIEAWEDYEAGVKEVGGEAGVAPTGLKRWWTKPKVDVESGGKRYSVDDLKNIGSLQNDPTTKLLLKNSNMSLSDMYGKTLTGPVNITEQDGGQYASQHGITGEVTAKRRQSSGQSNTDIAIEGDVELDELKSPPEITDIEDKVMEKMGEDDTNSFPPDGLNNTALAKIWGNHFQTQNNPDKMKAFESGLDKIDTLPQSMKSGIGEVYNVFKDEFTNAGLSPKDTKNLLGGTILQENKVGDYYQRTQGFYDENRDWKTSGPGRGLGQTEFDTAKDIVTAFKYKKDPDGKETTVIDESTRKASIAYWGPKAEKYTGVSAKYLAGLSEKQMMTLLEQNDKIAMTMMGAKYAKSLAAKKKSSPLNPLNSFEIRRQ